MKTKWLVVWVAFLLAVLIVLLVWRNASSEPFYVIDVPTIRQGWQAEVKMTYPVRNNTRTFATSGFERNGEWVLYDMQGLPPGSYLFQYKVVSPPALRAGWSDVTEIILLPRPPAGRLGKE